MTPEKILCVDDDPIMLFAIEKELRSHFSVITALSGEQALSLLKDQGPFAVILADMLMPEMNGVELLAHAQRVSPDTVRIMLTGDEDKQTAVEAINEGRIFRFLSKPCPPEKLVASLQAGLEQFRLIRAERELLEETLNGSVQMLTELLSTREAEAFGRGQKIREYVRAVAPTLNLTQSWDVEAAAMLAKIGLMSIPPSVMQKVHARTALGERERNMLSRVPEVGFNVLSKIRRLEPAAKIVLYQNKSFDGTGFPKETMEGIQIPAGSRLIKILNDLVDLEANGVSQKRAFEQMRQNRRMYDMAILESVAGALLPEDASSSGGALRLAELRPGHDLAADVETEDGRMIVAAGTVISQMMVERLANFAELGGVKEPVFVKKR